MLVYQRVVILDTTVLSPIFQLGTHMSTSYLDDTVLDPGEMDVTDVVSILFPWTNGTVLFFSSPSAPNWWKNTMEELFGSYQTWPWLCLFFIYSLPFPELASTLPNMGWEAYFPPTIGYS